MRLIIIADESVYEHEVDPSMEVQDVMALIEAEAGIPPPQIRLTTDSGTPLEDAKRSLESYGLTGESSTVFLSIAHQTQPQASSSSARSGPLAGFGSSAPQQSNPAFSPNSEVERMRLQLLGNPDLMREILQNDPEMAEAALAGTQRFRQALTAQRARMQDAASEKERQIEALNADPYDIEAQKKIEEFIRMEQVEENMNHAMEYSPESFGHVSMLYINVEVNGRPVKAFVDSGAQRTIISPECAERCGIMRLIDTRFQSIAVGVGTAQILGRIHSAQIKLGSLHLPCSFTVLEGKGVELLFGLDMLKRYTCNIDLAANVLRIQSVEIPFLAEHELPQDMLTAHAAAAAASAAASTASGSGSGSTGGQIGAAGAPGPSSSAQGKSKANTGAFSGVGNTVGGGSGRDTGFGRQNAPPGATDAAREGRVKEEDVQTLVGLGAERAQAIQLLEAAGGNVDYAASMLFGGGVSWS